ncbi:DNA polymerase III subunit delta' [Stappia indica]|uniref:DNA polymerase III subunit delta n=1 Tax=Stappia indica TaxID=538381 RepID=A0A857C2L3_9HYPH|nr:DNA polymerase III subunit delta' [Stappia indica]QGZ33203.1 DNA polymerase III subunit delta' [Stappia indica]
MNDLADPLLTEADAIEDVPLPRERDHLIGHREAEAELLSAYRSRRMHHAWILAGPKGIGKATLAFRFARFALAHPDPATAAVAEALDCAIPANHPDFRKVAAGAHPGLLHLRRPYDPKRKAKDKIKQDLTVDEIRRTVPFFGSTGSEGSWRICIVDAADDMNVNAANALLKVLEEPPKRSLFLVLSHAPGRLLPTIRSRCRMLHLRALSREEVLSGLGELGVADPADRIAARAADLAQGSLRKAIKLAEGDSIDLADNFAKLIAGLPRLDAAAAHDLADQVSRSGADDAWSLFQDLVADHLHTRLGETGQGSLQRLVRLSEVWEKTSRAAREADAYNLDRKQIVLNTLRDLAETARA